MERWSTVPTSLGASLGGQGRKQGPEPELGTQVSHRIRPAEYRHLAAPEHCHRSQSQSRLLILGTTQAGLIPDQALRCSMLLLELKRK